MTLTGWLALAATATAAGITVGVTGRSLQTRWLRRLVTGLTVTATAISAAGTTWVYLLWSGDRTPLTLDVAPGVSYQRIVNNDPRPEVIHLADIDLDHGCPALITTTPTADGTVTAETATDFASRTGAALSINAAFFFPFKEYPHWSSYPRSGDPITVVGRVVIDGETYGTESEWDQALTVINGTASIRPVRSDADLAVPGARLLARDGEIVAPTSSPYPRSVVGVDVDTNHLLLVIVDGKQPGYSDGVTLDEIAGVLIDRGADDILELDGGGSASMATSVDGDTELLSRPSHQRIPGQQRPVATHLGVVDTCSPAP